MGSLDPDPDPGGQKWPTKVEKVNKFHSFWSAGCSFGAGGIFRNSFWWEKDILLVIKILDPDPDPDSLEMPNQDPQRWWEIWIVERPGYLLKNENLWFREADPWSPWPYRILRLNCLTLTKLLQQQYFARTSFGIFFKFGWGVLWACARAGISYLSGHRASRPGTGLCHEYGEIWCLVRNKGFACAYIKKIVESGS
jgi:hypothetical protein